MIKPEAITDVVQKVLGVLPQGACQLPAGIKQNLRDVLQAELRKMNVVSREEFDAQVKVLERTRQKLEQLQQRVDSHS